MKKLFSFLLIGLVAGSIVHLACASNAQPTESRREAPIGPGQGGSDPEELTGAGGADPAVASSDEGPALVIVSPRQRNTLPAGDVTVLVDVTAFKLVNWPGKPPTPGEGRLIFYLDAQAIPVDPDRSAGSGPGTYDTDEPSYTFRNVPPGRHVFGVQLIDHDGTPVDPPKAAMVTVNVR